MNSDRKEEIEGMDQMLAQVLEQVAGTDLPNAPRCLSALETAKVKYT